MNKELLLKVKNRILANPESFDMDDWGVYGEYKGDGSLELKTHCGTTQCIAGHAIVASGIKELDKPFWPDELGAEVLDISMLDARRLFYSFEWGTLSDDYNGATTPEEKAQIAARRIDEFIASMEAQS